MFVPVILDDIMGPCFSVFIFKKATCETRLRTLEGCSVSLKSLSRVQDRDVGFAWRNGRTYVSLVRGLWPPNIWLLVLCLPQCWLEIRIRIKSKSFTTGWSESVVKHSPSRLPVHVWEVEGKSRALGRDHLQYRGRPYRKAPPWTTRLLHAQSSDLWCRYLKC